MMKDKGGLDDHGDLVAAATGIPQEAPAPERGHGQVAEAADIDMRAVAPALSPLEMAAPERHPEEAAGTLIRLGGPELEAFPVLRPAVDRRAGGPRPFVRSVERGAFGTGA
ncbi:hypothetical protein [Streptomyces sp. RG80]|uniref:hypothetical protein n=1 Tax=Streptomyces sp. RG80 TaxID=3157340 RepID=UPI00338EA9F0